MNINDTSPPRTSTFKPWIEAARLRTLPLALAGTLVAGGLAASYGVFSISVFALMLLTAGSLQVLSNFANEYGDFVKGTDNERRIGPKRALQRGEITREQLRTGVFLLAAIAFASGIALIAVALGTRQLLPILGFTALGVAALVAAVKYTMGKGAYGYHALGDVAVFAFFGLASVLGGFFLYEGEVHAVIVLPALAVGLLSVGVLNLNNMRDIDNDRASGKNTVVVVVGPARARAYHYALVAGGSLCFLMFSMLGGARPLQWVYLVGLVPLALHLARVARIKDDCAALDREMKPLSMATLVVSVLFSVAINL